MNKNFKLIVIGNIVSSIAASLYSFCTSLFILDITKNAMIMSIFLAYSLGLSIIIQPLAGVYVEHHNKVKIMYITDFFFSLTDILLFFLLCVGNNVVLIMTLLYVNATINTMMSALFQPASAALIPNVVGNDYLQKAYSIFSIIGNVTNIFGIICASLLYSLIGYKWIVLINGTLIGISAFSELFIKIDESSNSDNGEKKNYLKEFIQGMNFLRGRKILVILLAYAVCINAFMAGIFSTTFPFLYKIELSVEPIFLGMMQVTISLGGIGGAVFVSKREIINKEKAVFGGFWGVAIVVWCYFITYVLFKNEKLSFLVFHIIYLILSFCIGILAVIIQVSISTIYTIQTDQMYLSRIMAIRMTLSTASAPIAMLIFGGLLNCFPVKIVFMIASIGILFIVIFLRAWSRHLGE